ncbi:energy transducer TonB [Kushneria sp. Sum13]|uniref:energy transducer TonB n=1 Tax=Kushneria sp. Sum13 TaxID=3459196 RepID=UPI00404650B6
MRQALALLGALALALLLFWGLALMVAPPEPRETPQETMTMSIVDDVAAPAKAPEASTDIAAAAPPPPPPAAPARPAPAPQPAEDVQSDIQLKTQKISEPQAPDVKMNDDLPELDVERPEPTPEPKPEPRPRPTPTPPKKQTTPTPSSQGAQQSEQQGEQSGGTPEGATAQGGGVVQAQPTSRVQPEYPMRARRRGEEGFVEMSFIINADGSVDESSIQVTASEPGGVFDSAARDAIEQWQFPSRDAPARTRQRLVFKLR